MTIPLIILAVLSAIGGFIGIPELFSGEHGNLFHSFLEPVFKPAHNKLIQFGSHTHFEEILLMIVSIVGAAAGIYFAYQFYLKKTEIPEKISRRFKGAYNLLLNKYFVDEAYETTVVNPIVTGSKNILWKITDSKIIDGLVNNLANFVGYFSSVIRKLQTGVAQSYAMIMMVGILIALFWIIIHI